MIEIQKNSENLAVLKLQQIVDKAVISEADAVTIEFAKEGGLEVLFQFGSTSIGNIFVERELEEIVMSLIFERSGLEESPSGLLHWESRGKNLKIKVEEYDSFGETALKLIFSK